MSADAWREAAARAARVRQEAQDAGLPVPVVDDRPAPRRPQFPHRVRAFMYACAKVSAIMDEKMRDDDHKTGAAAVAALRASRKG